MIRAPRIHVFGASASGTSTLGRELARSIGVPHVDTDDVYWLPMQPSYSQARPVAERLALLQTTLDDSLGWVLSGSLCGWGDVLRPRFDLAVLTVLAADERMRRLKARERLRYGAAIEPGGARHAAHLEFVAWAASYDTAEAPTRSRRMHLAWSKSLPCPLIEIDSARPVEALVIEALAGVDRLTDLVTRQGQT